VGAPGNPYVDKAQRAAMDDVRNSGNLRAF
jgi:hypothetical protein